MSEPVLLVEDLGPVRRLTMNRPGSLNALNKDLVDAMSGALDEAADDERRPRPDPPGRRESLLRRVRPQRGRDRGRAGRSPVARRPHALDRGDAQVPGPPEAGDRERPLLSASPGAPTSCSRVTSRWRPTTRTSATSTSGSGPGSSRCSCRGWWASARPKSCSSRARIVSPRRRRFGSGSSNRVVPRDELDDATLRLARGDREERALRDPGDEARGEHRRGMWPGSARRWRRTPSSTCRSRRRTSPLATSSAVSRRNRDSRRRSPGATRVFRGDA